ncbi:unnamed protein product [Caretta caretta]
MGYPEPVPGCAASPVRCRLHPGGPQCTEASRLQALLQLRFSIICYKTRKKIMRIGGYKTLHQFIEKETDRYLCTC